MSFRLAIVRRHLLPLLLTGCTMSAAAETPPTVPQTHAPAGAPNVVVVLLDDVGFAATSTFGGPAATPTLDALAAGGLRYNRFHTTGVCSPTRASLLTGRNPHAVGVGALMNTPSSYPGYRSVLQPDSATIAEVLRQRGYNTALFGKWHLTPDWEASPSGPFDRWPTGAGFEKFYGFLGGETDQFHPTLYEGTAPVPPQPGADYHLTEDLATRAIQWLQTQHAMTPGKPFFLYFAPGATHAPLQAPKPWIDRYRGRFDQGWDAIRAPVLARQQALGLVPAGTRLTPRPDGLPAWDALTDDQRTVAARLMEIYAGFMSHTDAQIGRLVTALQDSGQFDNTLFIYIVGDNGGSAEGMAEGSLNYMGKQQGMPETAAGMLARLDRAGDASTAPHYPAGWAWALGTPLPWVKTVASGLGAIRNGMVLSWPKKIAAGGGVRSQFSHVNDIAPTILEAAGIAAPATVDGVAQRPLDGVSLLYSFGDAAAPERHTTQYFEVFGHRALYHEGWFAAAFHQRLPWEPIVPRPPRDFESDVWQLFDLRGDFSQSTDLAAQQPQKLAEMKQQFLQVAAQNQVLPLQDTSQRNAKMPSLAAGRSEFTFPAGAVGIPETALGLHNRSWRLTATFTVPAGGAHGAIAALGGTPAGLALWLDENGRPRWRYRFFDAQTIDLGGVRPLAAGPQQLQVEFDYDGGGYGKGGVMRLRLNGETIGEGRLAATVPGFFTVDETFDIGLDTGSPAGGYPAGYPFTGAIEKVRIELR